MPFIDHSMPFCCCAGGPDQRDDLSTQSRQQSVTISLVAQEVQTDVVGLAVMMADSSQVAGMAQVNNGRPQHKGLATERSCLCSRAFPLETHHCLRCIRASIAVSFLSSDTPPFLSPLAWRQWSDWKKVQVSKNTAA